MPQIKANGITINYDQQGSGEPLILIPFLAADLSCYAFQVADYAKHFTCLSVDLRGAGGTDKPEGTYSTELFSDDLAAFMHALGIEKAHISGMSLGAATGMWLAAKYPDKVKSLSLHSGWTKTDFYMRTVIEGWRVMAKVLDSVTEMTIMGIFPWSFTPKLYAEKPEYIQELASLLRAGPQQPLDAFMRQADAVLTHDIGSQLSKIQAPTQITFGRDDRLTSTRFAVPLQNGIAHSELVIFDGCAHAPISEDTATFNAKTLAFLMRQLG